MHIKLLLKAQYDNILQVDVCVLCFQRSTVKQQVPTKEQVAHSMPVPDPMPVPATVEVDKVANFQIYLDPELLTSPNLTKDQRDFLIRRTITNMKTTTFLLDPPREPSNTELESMAKQLVVQYPAMKDDERLNPDNPWKGIFLLLKRRLGNDRTVKNPQGKCPSRSKKWREANKGGNEGIVVNENGHDENLANAAKSSTTRSTSQSRKRNSLFDDYQESSLEDAARPSVSQSNTQSRKKTAMSDEYEESSVENTAMPSTSKSTAKLRKRKALSNEDEESSQENAALPSSPQSTAQAMKRKALSDEGEESTEEEYNAKEMEKHYAKLTEHLKKKKPNAKVTTQLMNLEFPSRRAFIDNTLRTPAVRIKKVSKAYPCFVYPGQTYEVCLELLLLA